MRYPASEKLEIIRLVERSHLPAKQTLDMLSVPRTTFYRWYERYRLEGQDALQDKRLCRHAFGIGSQMPCETGCSPWLWTDLN